ncbi:MAG: N-acetylmuramoyl-L-alanine amidase [Bauldia sp.]|nr:N-acetylmuramoyl-L-alanine amidase [Bauldia sp.]
MNRPKRRFARYAVLAAFLAAVAGPTAAESQTIAPIDALAVRVAGDGQRTRFVADLTGSVDFSVFTLADPSRVVIDLPEVRFSLAGGSAGEGRGLISAYRYGLISRGKSRIVLDLAGPVTVDKTFILPAAEGQPARLVVDLVAATEVAFMAEVANFRASLAPPVGDDPAYVAGNDGVATIVIDPGHGGIDSGAVSPWGTLEKDVVLEFARALAAKLGETDGYEVRLTRADDTFIGLSDRVSFARAERADLFISIHADSFSAAGVRGASVYTLSERPSTMRAAELAEAENRSDIVAGFAIEEDTESGVADILLDLARRETMNFSNAFARNLVEEFGERVLLHRIPLQEAGFRVLMAPDIPSVLVEVGFLSNREDDRLLNSTDWRDRATDSVVAAVDEFFRVRLARGVD